MIFILKEWLNRYTTVDGRAAGELDQFSSRCKIYTGLTTFQRAWKNKLWGQCFGHICFEKTICFLWLFLWFRYMYVTIKNLAVGKSIAAFTEILENVFKNNHLGICYIFKWSLVRLKRLFWNDILFHLTVTTPEQNKKVYKYYHNITISARKKHPFSP